MGVFQVSMNLLLCHRNQAFALILSFTALSWGWTAWLRGQIKTLEKGSIEKHVQSQQ